MEFLSWLFDNHYVLATFFMPMMTLCWAYFNGQKLKMLVALCWVLIRWAIHLMRFFGLFSPAKASTKTNA